MFLSGTAGWQSESVPQVKKPRLNVKTTSCWKCPWVRCWILNSCSCLVADLDLWPHRSGGGGGLHRNHNVSGLQYSYIYSDTCMFVKDWHTAACLCFGPPTNHRLGARGICYLTVLSVLQLLWPNALPHVSCPRTPYLFFSFFFSLQPTSTGLEPMTSTSPPSSKH